MTYRSLLVLLDRNPACEARMRAAIGLAGKFCCHLVGLAPTGLVDVPMPIETTAGLAEFAADARDVLRGEAEQAAGRFRDECREARIESFEAVVDESDQALSLLRHAHCSDLAVLTQADPGARDHRAAQALVEQVVLASARPTLVLPYAGGFDAPGSCVLVAWDDSREASRALSDALPLLRLAGRVHVERWNEGSDDDDDDKAPRRRLDALHGWLARQGVSAELRVEPADSRVAEAMLSRASDLGADLIVMGAYGHARWAERVLGGATHRLLASMTVPLLMSH